ncbi:MAG: ATP-binding protein [Bacillota bacterium]
MLRSPTKRVYHSFKFQVTYTNLEFGRWGEVFGDATLTAALLDRLTHHSHILLFNGESCRFRESQRQDKTA